jgi:hypothetical protein
MGSLTTRARVSTPHCQLPDVHRVSAVPIGPSLQEVVGCQGHLVAALRYRLEVLG